MGGVYTALDAAQADRVIVVACDMPFLHEGLLRRLVDLTEEADAAWVRTPDGVEPLLACYRRAAAGALREAIVAGRLKLADLGSRLRIRELDADGVAAFGPVDELVANVNSPEDLRKVE